MAKQQNNENKKNKTKQKKKNKQSFDSQNAISNVVQTGNDKK